MPGNTTAPAAADGPSSPRPARPRALDDLARLAATLCDASMAAVVVTGSGGPEVLAHVGAGAADLAKARASLPRDVTVVPDAHADPALAAHPLVTRAPHVRLLAVAPVHVEQRGVVGALVVADPAPRTLTPTQEEGLRALARLVALHFRYRGELRARDTLVASERRAARVLEGEVKVLELLARDADLEDVLAGLVRVIEDASPGVRASVLLADASGARLRHGAAPNLPAAYVRAIDGLPMGPREGSCGTAAFTREPVHVRDVRTDPRWHAYREAAERAGLRACWSVPVLAADGGVLGTFAMYHGTPRLPTKAEVRLASVAAHLARLAIERKRAADARDAARRDAEVRGRLAALGTLVAGVAHEVNNPLTFMSGNASFTRTAVQGVLDRADLREEDRAALREVLAEQDDILRGIQRITRITQGLNRLTHAEPGPASAVDANALVREAADAALGGRAGRVDVRTAFGAGARVRACAAELRQAIANLVLNAAEAVDGAGDARVMLSTRDDGDAVVIEVTDSGPGIPEADADRVFTPFFTTRPEGTGLGLSVSHRIVHAHGGTLTFTSDPGRGTTFRVRLPAVPQA